MLAALNLGAVLVGVAAGGLVASLVALVSSGVLVLLGVDSGAGAGLVVGILSGLVTGGWVSGARARHSSRFHGAVTGLAMAFFLLVIAILGGGQASTVTVIWLAVLSAVVAGLAGWLAGRRRTPPG